MMRKIHRVALAALLKPAASQLMPAFSMASVAWARALDAERRFTFHCRMAHGLGFLIVEASSTARDNYFTADVAWVRDTSGVAPEDIGDTLSIAETAPWRSLTEADLFARAAFRLRIDDLWKSSPSHYRGAFEFPTASSRYSELLFSPHGLEGKAREERAFQLLQTCVAEEKALTAEDAAAEVTPALELLIVACREAAIPALQRADALCAEAETQTSRAR